MAGHRRADGSPAAMGSFNWQAKALADRYGLATDRVVEREITLPDGTRDMILVTRPDWWTPAKDADKLERRLWHEMLLLRLVTVPTGYNEKQFRSWANEFGLKEAQRRREVGKRFADYAVNALLMKYKYLVKTFPLSGEADPDGKGRLGPYVTYKDIPVNTGRNIEKVVVKAQRWTPERWIDEFSRRMDDKAKVWVVERIQLKYRPQRKQTLLNGWPINKTINLYWGIVNLCERMPEKLKEFDDGTA